jgi:hypothetical protein
MWHAWDRREKCTRFWWETQKERDHVEDRGVAVRMGSQWILGRLDVGCGVDSTGSGSGPVAGSCECGDEHCVLASRSLSLPFTHTVTITLQNPSTPNIIANVRHA